MIELGLFIKKIQGQAVARNVALDISKGEYITFVDSDDTVEKDFLSYYMI